MLFKAGKMSIMNNRGFSLLETVIALGILVVGIGGAVGLVAQSLASIEAIKNKVISANLAQEGIEVVRNLRDENWLNDVHWRGEGGGIALNFDGDYRVQYNATALISYLDAPLQVNSAGYYGYNGQTFNAQTFSGGSDTVFKRKLTISTVTKADGTQVMKVVSRVDWTEKGRAKFIEIEDRLYNWK